MTDDERKRLADLRRAANDMIADRDRFANFIQHQEVREDYYALVTPEAILGLLDLVERQSGENEPREKACPECPNP